MKKFIVAVCVIVAAALVWNIAYYRLGIYIDLAPNAPVTTFMRTDEDTIYMKQNGEYTPYEIRGVDMGVGIPGEWTTDFAIDEETYLRWFSQIQELGANTIRVYTILHDDFYNAFFKYNTEREKMGREPLYLLHGVWVNDYIINSHRDAYDDEFFKTLKDDCRTLVDVLHGKISLSLSYGNKGSGSYRKDVSQWVIGYIIGVEWETSIVTYTNQNSYDKTGYKGKYLQTTEDATPFETMLCEAGDKMIEYESKRYKQQRLMSFENGGITDPFIYPITVTTYRNKTDVLNVEHIKTSDSFISGYFASYHVYPYFPDFLQTMLETKKYKEKFLIKKLDISYYNNLIYRLSLLNAPKIEDYLLNEDYYDSQGRRNTYLAYLKVLNRFHNIPVVISEYGVTTGRGMAQRDKNTNRNQGNMTEQEQGQALIDCYKDIKDAGCAGSCVFSWQDEWFKRTWNTMYAVDLDNTPYWSDFQTNDQFFGLLSFDPGEEKSVCYVDGDISEWTEKDKVVKSGDMDLSMKYDEKFLYFLVHKENFDPENDTLYLPIDTNPKIGSTYCENYDVSFERASDFLMVISGKENSRIVVQERYEALMSTYANEYYAIDPYVDPPKKDSPVFKKIYMPLRVKDILPNYDTVENVTKGEKYETGNLRYGNANPDAEDFDSLSDFIFSGDYVEIRIPWQLLNFSNPSEMMIHDDYYECYGIENLNIDKMYVGIGSSENTEYRLKMPSFDLKGWGKTVTYHERLKKSYYMLKDYWTSQNK